LKCVDKLPTNAGSQPALRRTVAAAVPGRRQTLKSYRWGQRQLQRPAKQNIG